MVFLEEGPPVSGWGSWGHRWHVPEAERPQGVGGQDVLTQEADHEVSVGLRPRVRPVEVAFGLKMKIIFLGGIILKLKNGNHENLDKKTWRNIKPLKLASIICVLSKVFADLAIS